MLLMTFIGKRDSWTGGVGYFLPTVNGLVRSIGHLYKRIDRSQVIHNSITSRTYLSEITSEHFEPHLQRETNLPKVQRDFRFELSDSTISQIVNFISPRNKYSIEEDGYVTLNT